MMSVTIAQLRGPLQPDARATKLLLEMIAAGCREEQAYVPGTAFILDCARRDLQEDLLAGESPWWIAWDQQTPVGLVRLGPTGGERPHERLLTSLYVAETHRMHGIGRQLVEAALAAAKEAGYKRVYAFVADTNPAQGFYDRLGLFRAVGGSLPGYVKLQWECKSSPAVIKGLGLAAAVLGGLALIIFLRGR